MVGSSVADEFKLLRSCLETHARGKVHPLVGILGLIVRSGFQPLPLGPAQIWCHPSRNPHTFRPAA